MRLLYVLLMTSLAASDIFRMGMSLGPGLSIKNAVLYPIALGLLFRMAITGRFRMRLPAVNMAFVLWIGYAILTWIVCVTVIHYPGYDPIHKGIELKSMLIDAALFFFVYFYGMEGEQDFLLFSRALAFLIGIANLLTLADLAGITHLGITIGQQGVEADRVFGVFGHANDTATLLVCLLPMLVAVSVSSRGWARLFWYSGAFASVAVLVLTVSRTGYLGALVGYTGGVVLCRRHLPTSRVVSWTLLGVTAAVLAAGLGAVLMPDMAQVIYGRLFNQSMAISLSVASSGRTTIWMTAIDTMVAHPITLVTGFGWNVYHTMFVLVTHNYYLDLWFGLGVIGLFAFLTILYQTVITARRAIATAGQLRPYMIALVFGTLGLSVCLFFDNLDKPWSYVWIYLGFSLRAAADIVEKAESRAVAPAPRAPPKPVVSAATVRARRDPGVVGDLRR